MESRKRRIISDNEDKPADLSKEWDETMCPICMEHPHNAILLVCSSHDKGCRSYICDTSYRHSNCLDRFKKLKEKNPNNTSSSPDLNPGTFPVTVTFPVSVPGSASTFPVSVDTFPVSVPELKCPLCRGTVSGFRVIEEARKYLDSKLRSCSRESCVFSGNYGELREHARKVHPTVRPADVDPSRERAWRQLEDQREYNDIVSAVDGGSVVVGDYAVERGGGNGATRGDFDTTFDGDFMTTLLLHHMMHRRNLDLVPVVRTQRPRLRGYGRTRPPAFVERGMYHDTGTNRWRRRRFLWGENLVGLRNHDDDDDDDDNDEEDEDNDDEEEEEDDEEDDEEEDEDEEEDDEVDINMLSDIGPPRRRLRRRITQTRSENEDRQ